MTCEFRKRKPRFCGLRLRALLRGRMPRRIGAWQARKPAPQEPGDDLLALLFGQPGERWHGLGGDTVAQDLGQLPWCGGFHLFAGERWRLLPALGRSTVTTGAIALEQFGSSALGVV